MKKLVAALIQQSCTDNRDENVSKTIGMIRKAAKTGAKLVALQELHTNIYFCQQEDTANFNLAEPIPGLGTEIFGSVAKELGIVLVTSLFEKRAPGIYHNTAVIFESDGTIAGIYRKMHIPDDPGFYEKFYFTQGDRGFKPVQTSIGKLGVLICWDQWYPEAARLMALAGAEILIYPTAIGWDPSDGKNEQQRQLDAWVTIQRSHAIANGIPLLSINRAGFENDPSGQGKGIDFWGNSFIAGCQGEFIAKADQTEEIVIAEIDMERSEKVRRIWPFLRDRRIDAYDGILKRYIE
ncbi:MAG: carbon-nitrogen hydrolase [Desulfuromonadales bacterium]|nr:carbon-nitrogen hydrolase [Desulfuromonadales bacterium]